MWVISIKDNAIVNHNLLQLFLSSFHERTVAVFYSIMALRMYVHATLVHLNGELMDNRILNFI